MTDKRELLIEKKDDVAVLTLNRPECANAMNASILEDLAGSLGTLADEGRIRCVVLRGAGEKAFSVGMDLAVIAEAPPEDNLLLIGEGGPLRKAIAAIESFPYPIIAMVYGYAAGAACELAIACDLRTGDHATKMGMPPAKVGIVYPLEGLDRFVRVLGLAVTRKLFHTARYLEGDELFSMGVLDFLTHGDLWHFTMELASEVAALAPMSQRSHKILLGRLSAAGGALTEDLRIEARALAEEAIRSEDGAEGVRAFLEKRPPRFGA